MEKWWVLESRLEKADTGATNTVSGGFVRVVKLADMEALERRVKVAEGLLREARETVGAMEHDDELDEFCCRVDNYYELLAAEPRK